MTLMLLLSSFNLHPYFAPVQVIHAVAYVTKEGRVLQRTSWEQPHILQNQLS